LAAVGIAARRDALPLGAIFLAIAVAALMAAAVLPLDRLPFAACTFKALTGWPCLTCGSTRAFARLAAGDLPGALAMNPLATAGALALVPWGMADLALLARGRALSIELGPSAWRALRFALPLAALLNWAYLVAAGI
jgi:hypothetical protein